MFRFDNRSEQKSSGKKIDLTLREIDILKSIFTDTKVEDTD